MSVSNHILIGPPDWNILAQIHGRALIVNISDPGRISAAIAAVRESGNRLQGIRLFCSEPLSRLRPEPEWMEPPLAVYVPETGYLRETREQARWLREAKARLYLPLDRAENYDSARVLASLGVAVTVIQTVRPDWEALIDLAAYAILGQVPRGPLDPFTTMAGLYTAGEPLDVSAIYFNDPRRYLHLNPDGRVALDGDDLAVGRFVLDDASQLDAIADCAGYRSRLAQWRQVFLRFEGCSICPSWRVCLGHAAKHDPDRTGCQGFYAELLEILDRQPEPPRHRRHLWQP